MTDEPTSSTDLDEVLAALADRRRRYALYYLRERDEASVERLADVVATWLHVREGRGPVDRTDRDRTMMSLYHVHLPQLAEIGLVEYDRTEGTVRLVPPTETVDPLLETTGCIEHATRMLDGTQETDRRDREH